VSVDPDHLPVIIGTGQCVERTEVVTSRDLMARAARLAFDDAPGVAARVERVVAVNVLGDEHPRPAGAVARRLGLAGVTCETTVVGGNTPQWLITQMAEQIAAGRQSAVLLVGGEAQASPKRGALEEDIDADLAAAGEPELELGTDRLGFGEAERNIRLWLPIHIYPMFESAMAARAGRSFAEQRRFIAGFMARATSVAAKHPCAWFPTEATPDELATPTDVNRLTAEPYTKRMNAIMAVDQAAALVMTSLGVARDLGLADQAVYVWSGADATDVWFPSQRPELHRSPGIAAAGGAALDAAAVDVDAMDHLDFYSCFPSAVQAGAEALGVALDDPRGLTVTGGLAYFGGPGNNYPMHSVATTVGRLRDGGGLGLCTGLGWFTTKHSVGIYGAQPPPQGFRRGDTTAAQHAIDASERPLALDAEGPATVVAATVTYGRDGAPETAPVFADLADGRRVAALAHPDDLADLAGVSLVGHTVRLVGGEPLSYRVDG
jgi:acetyl-CoA C-acetyltransferase